MDDCVERRLRMEDEWWPRADSPVLDFAQRCAPAKSMVAKGGFTRAPFCLALRAGEIDGGQGRNRTTDTRIFSPLLYRLSYLATVLQIHLEWQSHKNLPAATHTRILALATELLGLRQTFPSVATSAAG